MNPPGLDSLGFVTAFIVQCGFGAILWWKIYRSEPEIANAHCAERDAWRKADADRTATMIELLEKYHEVNTALVVTNRDISRILLDLKTAVDKIK